MQERHARANRCSARRRWLLVAMLAIGAVNANAMVAASHRRLEATELEPNGGLPTDAPTSVPTTSPPSPPVTDAPVTESPTTAPPTDSPVSCPPTETPTSSHPCSPVPTTPPPSSSAPTTPSPTTPTPTTPTTPTPTTPPPTIPDSPSPIPSVPATTRPPPTRTPPSSPVPPPSTGEEAVSPSPVPRLPTPAVTWYPTTQPTNAPGSDTTGNEADGSNGNSGSTTGSNSGAGSPSSSSPSSASTSSSSSRPAAASNSSSGSDGAGEKNTPTATTVNNQRPSSAFREACVYLSVICAAVSIALLVLFHVVAFNTGTFDWPHSWLSANGWELLLYVGYIQQLTSLSHMELFQSPSSLWQYTDAFSWANFLIQRNTLASSATGSTARRLAGEELYGVSAYADRVDISASDLLLNAVVGVAIVLAVIGFVFACLSLCGRKVLDDKFDIESSTVSAATQGMSFSTRRRGTLCALGFGVIVWFIALYPLTTLAVFDLASLNTNTALDIAVLVLVCVVCLGGLAVVVIPKSDERLMSTKNLKLYGALYADTVHSFRWFFVVTSLAQIALGICTGAIHEEATQLTVALIIVVGYLLTMLLCSPFTSQTPLYFAAAVCVLKITIYSIAFAFVTDKSVSLSGRTRAADAIIGLSTLVILLWLVRLVAMLVVFIRLYAERRSDVPNAPTPFLARQSLKDNGSVTTNPLYAGSGVFVTMMTPEQLGSEFDESTRSENRAPQPRPTRMAMAL